ncbi:GNAT family N-acetyltransferase [Hazenella sp. IB182357]|uniref:GNAT family N-acetyltransferase n=1 Tax=Polycladospora coralii TaxID=2771432 RepID=A0A926ND10_9BACL|nr:GNAT family N-acetyltransferase [Polycladospora coralii]MBD1373130.1 GNAT family N-acetyltransferase [Polycladospora coralii]
MFHHELTDPELAQISQEFDREDHLLYYSYLTVRKRLTRHFGQYRSDGALLGIMAYCEGLPFFACAYLIKEKTCDLTQLFAYICSELRLPPTTCGSTLVSQQDLAWFVNAFQTKLIRNMVIMKHAKSANLPSYYDEVQQIKRQDYGKVKTYMQEMDALIFTEDSFNRPFWGIMDEGELVAIGGFHSYQSDYVEIGNIGTASRKRRQGFGKKVVSELTRQGKACADDIYLYVEEHNHAAIRMYESLGYTRMHVVSMMEFGLHRRIE